MSSLRRPLAQTTSLLAASAVLTGLVSATAAQALTGTPAADGGHPYAVRLDLGDEANSRGCTGALIDASWVLTAATCFAPVPGTAPPAGKPALKTIATLSDGKAVEVVDIAPRTDRDVVLARLATPVTGIAGVKRATAAPAAGSDLTAVGFGRTKTEWVPGKLRTGAFTTDTADATTLAITGKGADAICKGDTGGPLLNAAGELVGVNSRSWQGGCLGTAAAETRTGAVSVRTDDLAGWIDQVRAEAPGWKTAAVVQAGTSLYQGIRLPGGDWTGFTDVQSKAGNIGGIRAATVAGIGSDTHVVALADDGSLRHTVRKADGTWSTFGDIGAAANVLGGVTRVSAVSIGNDLHVLAVASGKVFHTVRKADGNWTKFGDLSAVAGPIGTVTSVATASAGGQLQVAAVSGGKAFHTIRTAAGHWAGWGSVADAASATGPISSVSMAGTGDDAHIVIATDNGARQYHGMRKGTGHWEAFAELKDVLGTVNAKSVAAAAVDGELQLAVTTSDNKALHTVRHADRTWNPATQVNLHGVIGTGPLSINGPLTAISVAGTL